MYRGGGLGAYPGNPCYDSNRPSWFPNWLDYGNEALCNVRALVLNPIVYGDTPMPHLTDAVKAVTSPGLPTGSITGDTVLPPAGAYGQAISDSIVDPTTGNAPMTSNIWLWVGLGIVGFMLLRH